jgi:hypothetical protein
MKVNLLFGDDILTATWQKKGFSDEMAALEFIRKHRNKIYGINGVTGGPFSHFEIIDILRRK